MKPLELTLCADGPSDDMLLPVIQWALRQLLGDGAAINALVSVSRGDLTNRIKAALVESVGCDLLVVHRDAEQADGFTKRIDEINNALAKLQLEKVAVPAVVRVVPVRMSESWLLFDEAAIRRAAGRPSGRARLQLPPLKSCQTLADPKRSLGDAMDVASERAGRRLEQFKQDRRPSWVAERISDFSPLRPLDAFRAFEAEVAEFAARWLASADDTSR